MCNIERLADKKLRCINIKSHRFCTKDMICAENKRKKEAYDMSGQELEKRVKGDRHRRTSAATSRP